MRKYVIEEDLVFDDFLDVVWDYISMEVVSDDCYFKNENFFREITHNIYSYQNSKKEFNVRYAARLIEDFISLSKKYKPDL